MTKRAKNFTAFIVLGGICLVGAIVMIINETLVDITKERIVVGVVSEAEITFRRLRRKTQRIFFFKLKNSDENFTIYKSDYAYSKLEDSVRKGETVKVYYRSSPSRFNLDIYQVEKNGNVIFSYETYKEQASMGAGILLLGGVVILIAGVIYYTQSNLIKFLLLIVE